ncbi:OLC1v1025110C1 [Oldenlandia corymbosa var. corymbosa]|uniref:OLC1v1025110C1 n=1 Tax=Oldenlandia corymbosa var. corymbosa TaxID=529605 RepID=A0AAV1C5N2_OLDCO|nr:OLC1v1025110C1 [Oldenlandia corymbosa var. corymbosa]
METRSSKRKRLSNAKSVKSSQDHHHHHEDRISDLPDAVLHLVLCPLPIKSIAQTSILSKRWRNLWYSFPDLDFTTLEIITSGDDHHHPTDNVSTNVTNNGKTKRFQSLREAEIIDRVLTCRRVCHKRQSYSDIRVLRVCASLSFSMLNTLIRRATKFNVQELDIEVITNDYFNFPRCVIFSESLRVLKLKSRHPGFRLPPLMVLKGGFQSLVSLSLSQVMLHDQPSLVNLFSSSNSFPRLKKLCLEKCIGLKHLNVSCRFLEDLTLENCFHLEDLEICSPKLESLRVVDCFDSYSSSSWFRMDAPALRVIFWSYSTITETIVLENLNSLQDAFVGFFSLHGDLSATKLRSVSNFLSGISNSQSLTLESSCIEILSRNYHLGGFFQYPYLKLKSMEIQTDFNKHNLPGLATIFRNSPTVHTLIIKIENVHNDERRKWNRDLWESSGSGEEKYWESQSRAMSSFLHNLKVVKIHGFTECENDISFVKFLLKHGKVLQEMFLSIGVSRPRNSLERDKIKSQIRGFSRASYNAKILFQ